MSRCVDPEIARIRDAIVQGLRYWYFFRAIQELQELQEEEELFERTYREIWVGLYPEVDLEGVD